MNKTLGSAISSVVVTFFVTLTFNTLLNYYSSNKGVVSVSPPVKLGPTAVVIVTLENQSSAFLSDLVLEVPSGLTISTVTTDPALVVEEIPSTLKNPTKLLKLSQVHPRKVSRVFIPLDTTAASSVRISNLEATGLSLRQDDHLESPLRHALVLALISSVIYGIIISISTYITFNQQRKLEQKMDDLNEKSDAATAKIERLRGLISKQRLLLQSRLYDYSKELNFWRNAVRTILLQSGASTAVGDTLIERVTSELKTFGTREDTEKNFETLRLAGRWLADAENEIGGHKSE